MRFPIKIFFYAYFFIAVGSFFQNGAVNLIYTFKNPYVLLLSELLIQIGSTLIKILPLVTIVRIASRREKSGTPILLGIVGYVTFLVSTMIFQNPEMISDMYGSFINISYNVSTSKGVTALRYPIDTGMVGAFIVGYITRWSYIKSRNRNNVSIFAFLEKDTVGYVYVILACIAAGFGVSYVWPYFSNWTTTLINYVSTHSSSPRALGLYGVLDRVYNLLGIGGVIRNPFWFGVKGGSYVSSSTGNTILGDVNIYTRLSTAGLATVNYGKYVSGYYCLNFFVIPAIMLSLYSTISNKAVKLQSLIGVIGVCLLSIVFGNPLAIEMYLLFSAPIAYVFYLVVVALVFGATSYFKSYVGYSFSGDLTRALPGNLPDFLYKLRDLNYSAQLLHILIIGLVAGIVMFIFIRLYVKQFAYDFYESGKKGKIAARIVDAVGGAYNITDMYSSPYLTAIELENHELIDFESLKQLGISKIAETNEGITIYSGLASDILRREIDKEIAKVKRN